MKRPFRVLLGALALAIVIAAGSAVVVVWTLRASLPRTSGEVRIPGLHAPVELARDDDGIAVLRGSDLEDLFRAQGFAHAQDRFFQMDLARRDAAGELAELFGEVVLVRDRSTRVFRFRALAREVLARAKQKHLGWLNAYTSGVNAGLESLGRKPPEYVLLGAETKPWKAEDTVLVVYGMCETLGEDLYYERLLAVLHTALPEELVRFLTPDASRFDAPLLGRNRERPRLAIPGPEVVDLRGQLASAALPAIDEVPANGSNSWAVAGSRTKHGGAIVANDMHLSLSVPAIWYRVQLEWGGRRATGVSLPGIPGLVIGTNGRLAWGLTAAQVDVQDLVLIEAAGKPGHYRTPDGPEAISRTVEEIRVRDGDPVQLEVRGTRWGPIVDRDASGRERALKWSALAPEAVNLEQLDMLTAATLEQGIEVARAWYGPSVNVVLGDRVGRIAWVLSGWMPERRGFDGSVPVSWASGEVGWTGAMSESERPMIVEPESGVLFTANNRTMALPQARRFARAWVLGARAGRIEELLGKERGDLDEQDLFDMQLDVRSPLHDLYRDLVLDVVAPDDADPLLRRVREIAEGWDGTAGTDQAAYRILRAVRFDVHGRILGPLVAPCQQIRPGFRFRWPQAEETVRRILEKRPLHLLDPRYDDWNSFLRDVIAGVAENLGEGVEQTWGEVNRAALRHPISRGLPALASFLDMPADPLPGDSYTVRVSRPSYGASERMVVTPGQEESGILQIPSGQSGHPLSRHYRDMQAAWVEGTATALLADETGDVLRLTPE